MTILSHAYICSWIPVCYSFSISPFFLDLLATIVSQLFPFQAYNLLIYSIVCDMPRFEYHLEAVLTHALRLGGSKASGFIANLVLGKVHADSWSSPPQETLAACAKFSPSHQTATISLRSKASKKPCGRYQKQRTSKPHHRPAIQHKIPSSELPAARYSTRAACPASTRARPIRKAESSTAIPVDAVSRAPFWRSTVSSLD